MLFWILLLSCHNELKQRAIALQQRAQAIGLEVKIEGPPYNKENLEAVKQQIISSELLVPKVKKLRQLAQKTGQQISISGPPYKKEEISALKQQLEEVEKQQKEKAEKERKRKKAQAMKQAKQEKIRQQKAKKLEAKARSIGWQLRIEKDEDIDAYIRQLDWVEEPAKQKQLLRPRVWDRKKTKGWTKQDWKKAAVEYWVQLNDIRQEVKPSSLAAVRAYLEFLSPYQDWIGFDAGWVSGGEDSWRWDGILSFPVINKAEKWIQNALENPAGGIKTVEVCGKKIPYYADSLQLKCNARDDISALKELPHLISLSIAGLDDLSPLKSISKLQKLEADRFQGLGSLQQIRQLAVEPADFSQFSGLAALTKLTGLKLDLVSARGAPDLSPLGQLKNLEQLYLALGDHQKSQMRPSMTTIKGISFLSRLRKLKELTLISECTMSLKLYHLRPLVELRKLHLINECFLSSPISHHPSLKHYPHLQDVIVPTGFNGCTHSCDEGYDPEKAFLPYIKQREKYKKNCEAQNSKLQRTVNCKRKAWLFCTKSCNQASRKLEIQLKGFPKNEKIKLEIDDFPYEGSSKKISIDEYWDLGRHSISFETKSCSDIKEMIIQKGKGRQKETLSYQKDCVK